MNSFNGTKIWVSLGLGHTNDSKMKNANFLHYKNKLDRMMTEDNSNKIVIMVGSWKKLEHMQYENKSTVSSVSEWSKELESVKSIKDKHKYLSKRKRKVSNDTKGIKGGRPSRKG
ncbi:hypothetical protein LIER_33261 [Lithospermum erythrorhizon]|uniref:Uncharacterized protein n=1 Tax=Lithospermum erythrorhizon TaxID=34254 RepID=A0AAV3RWA1_LITER